MCDSARLFLQYIYIHIHIHIYIYIFIYIYIYIYIMLYKYHQHALENYLKETSRVKWEYFFFVKLLSFDVNRRVLWSLITIFHCP